MQKANFIKLLSVQFIVSLLLMGCSPTVSNTTLESTVTNSQEPTQIKIPLKTNTNTPTTQPTITSTPTDPLPKETSTPTPEWVDHEPGKITAPILLYHHVEGETSSSRYQVTIPNFHAQMQTLEKLGYTPIPISLLIDTLLFGGKLPEKSIVITFDDGHQSVYENAFPIMQELGFPGVFYIVTNRINGAPDFANITQLKDMIAAGWEIGSHSYTHVDLTQNHAIVLREIGQSKTDLEKALSTKVNTFAYPFGKIDPFSAKKVSEYGFRAGMGLGTSIDHSLNNLLYLNRIEIYGNSTIEDFIEKINSD